MLPIFYRVLNKITVVQIKIRVLRSATRQVILYQANPLRTLLTMHLIVIVLQVLNKNTQQVVENRYQRLGQKLFHKHAQTFTKALFVFAGGVKVAEVVRHFLA